MEEIWKVFIDNRSDDYHANRGALWEISNFGHVKKNGFICQLKLNKKTGYYYCSAVGLIHRAVAKLFIPNLDEKPCVDHIDGNKSNNCVDNLRWVTHKENNNNIITKQRLSNSLKGRTFSEEHKENCLML